MVNILLAILVFGLCLAGIALRVLLKKDKEVRGTCASKNPLFRNPDGSCPTCGQKAYEPCLEESKEE